MSSSYAGMDIARLNMSHGTHEDHAESYRLVRQASDASGHGVGIFADLQGPKIRLGIFPEGKVHLERGQRWTITTRDVPGDAEVGPTTYQGLPGDVTEGDPILIDDGKVRLRVTGVEDTEVHTEVLVGGHGQQPQGHQPARRRGLRAGALRQGRGRPALRPVALGRLRRPVLRAQRRRRRGRPGGHARGRHDAAGHRQDREAAGHREPRRGDRRLRRLHGRARRPRRGVPARGRAVPAEADRHQGPPGTPSRSSWPPRCSSR